MKTPFDIVTVLYDIIDVTGVTSLLTSGIHRNKRTEGLKGGTGVVIVPLPLFSGEDIIDDGVINLNVFAPPLSNNMVDDTTLDGITKALITAVKAYNNASHYWIFEIESQNLLSDERDETFVNLRINYFVEQ